MAVEWKCEHKRGSEYLFYPEEIVVKPENNGRVVPSRVDRLIKSFESVGQLQPVSIQNEGGSPVLVAGFTRWQAAMAFNKGKPRDRQMRLRCVLNRGNALDTAVINIHENHFRDPTKEMDDAHNIAKLMDRFGKTAEEVAEIYGEDVKWVKKRLKLLKLSQPAQDAVVAGEVKVTAAEKIAALSAEQQREAISNNGHVKTTRPSAKQVRTVIDLVSASPAYPKPVREFADKLLRFLAGEIAEGDL